LNEKRRPIAKLVGEYILRRSKLLQVNVQRGPIGVLLVCPSIGGIAGKLEAQGHGSFVKFLLVEDPASTEEEDHERRDQKQEQCIFHN